MFGIIVPPETEPYVTAQRLDLLLTFYPAGRRAASDAYLVELDPACATCGEEVPDWWAIDEHGDYIDVPLHDVCRKDYADEQHAGIYV